MGLNNDKEEDRLDRMTREAENARTKMFQTPGKEDGINIHTPQGNQLMNAVFMDDDYMVLAGHVDENMSERIAKGDYVDLAKLLPKDRLSGTTSEGQRLQLVIKNGQSFWVPLSESISINNYMKWEQAFRIFSDIYSQAHPNRSSELIQYSHIIHTISSQFIWGNGMIMTRTLGCTWLGIQQETGQSFCNKPGL